MDATAELYLSELTISKTHAALSAANVNKLVCLNDWLGL